MVRFRPVLQPAQWHVQDHAPGLPGIERDAIERHQGAIGKLGVLRDINRRAQIHLRHFVTAYRTGVPEREGDVDPAIGSPTDCQ
jgi:hypothetical protein